MAACRMRAEIAVPLIFDDNIAFRILSQRRIIADCMRANGWIWTTQETPTNTPPPPAAKTPPAAAAAPTKPLEPSIAERMFGKTPEASALHEVLIARRIGDSTNDPAWRASLADALHRYCESVLMRVPRNTPEEDRWVDSESNKVSQEAKADAEHWFEHLKRVENSVEFARTGLRNVLSECSSLTKNLIELKQTTPIAEALQWLRLSKYFESSFVASELGLAEIVGLVSPKYCKQQEVRTDALMRGKQAPPPPGAHDENDICSWDTVHRSIIDHALIPLLESSGGQ
jgi:hypothetical protein